MNRWAKFISIALIALFTVGFVSGSVVRADDGTATPEATAPRPGIMRTLANALLDAAVTATRLTKEDLVKQLGDGKTLSELLTANGATVDAVKASAKDAVTKQVKQAVTDGKLTQAVADKALGRLDTAFDRLLNAQFPVKQSSAARRLQNLGYAILVKETANQTKIALRDLLKELRDGKTLAQIAEANKVDVNVIVTAAVQKATARINMLVKNVKLKDDQAKTLLDKLQPELTKMMSGPSPLKGRQGKGSGKLGNSGDDLSTPEPVGTPGL